MPIALIPIDVQQGFDYPTWPPRNNPGMEANGQKLLAAWRAKGWPVLHVRHDSVELNSTLRRDHAGNAFRPGFEPQGEEPVIGKSVNSAFIGTDLDLRLRRLGITEIVLFGISTDMCVSTTTRMAANLGYKVTLVGDACFCFDLKDADGTIILADDIQRAHLATLRHEFATVVTTGQAIESLNA